MTADPTGALQRFLIIGLPRSGTTYLMSLLNSHPNVLCAGELFNPYGIIGTGGPDYDLNRIFERDWGPRFFAKQFFDSQDAPEHHRVGFKFMLGHNLRLLTQLPELPDLSLIYVHRENRLAQVASFMKAVQTKNWAQTRRSREMRTKIVASPQAISHQWHEYATMDFLFSTWLKTLPQPRITLEYRELFQPGFNQRICDFLKIPLAARMKSPLIKQGANRAVDRFENPEMIAAYFRHLGRAHWLERELP
jgi:LPS sulfotransferase NodH